MLRALVLGLSVLTVWAAPSVAAACSCGPYIDLISSGDQAPVDAIVRVGTCYGDPPGPDAFEVTVDGEPASLAAAIEPSGTLEAAYRVEPTPEPGQTVVITGCAWSDPPCEPTELLRFETVAADETAPQGSARMAVSRGEHIDDGVDCPPFGPTLEVRLEDIERSDNVTWLMVTATDPDGNLYRGNRGLDASASSAEVTVYVPEAEDVWCVEAHGMTIGGAWVVLANDCFDFGSGMPPDRTLPEEGCGCRTDGGGLGAFGLLLLLGIVRRRG